MTAAEVALPADASAAAEARRFVRSWLQAHDLEPHADTVLLLTSEIVTNAVLHTARPSHLTISSTGAAVRVELRDSSPTGPTRRRHSVSATTGRGLRLLEDLASEWGWRPDGGGKVLWFCVASDTDPWAAFTGTDWLAEAEL